MLEEIRLYIMNRWASNRSKVKKYQGVCLPQKYVVDYQRGRKYKILASKVHILTDLFIIFIFCN